MAKNKTPLYVLVDENNSAYDTTDSLRDPKLRQPGAVQPHAVKLFADHKGDKSRIGYQQTAFGAEKIS